MNLKCLKTVEDNLKIKDLKDGVYCYAGPDFIISYLSDLSNLRVRSDLSVTARKDSYYFKINKYSDEDIRFEGYISDQAEILLNKNKGLLDYDIMVFPKIHNEYKNIYEFSLMEKDVSVKTRYIGGIYDTIWIIDIKRIKSVEPIVSKNSQVSLKPQNKAGFKILNFIGVITNNQTAAGVLSLLISIFIGFLLIKYFGINIFKYL